MKLFVSFRSKKKEGKRFFLQLEVKGHTKKSSNVKLTLNEA